MSLNDEESKDGFSIKPVSSEQLQIAVGWGEKEGWNPGLHDAELYHKADPNGFFIGYLGDEPIASISAVRYNDTYGFIGYYIVHPEYRGKGYGLRIWKTAMAYLKGCAIGLDGVVAQQNNYKKSGFQVAYRNFRFEGKTKDVKELSIKHEHMMKPLDQVAQEDINTYAAPFYPVPREAFHHAWFAQADSRALSIVDKGRIQGVGVIRKAAQGFKIGPLWAETNEHAKSLLQALMKWAGPGQKMYLDAIDVNANAVKLAKELNMVCVFESARMYTAPVTPLPFERLYGVTSLEIG